MHQTDISTVTENYIVDLVIHFNKGFLFLTTMYRKIVWPYVNASFHIISKYSTLIK